MSSSGLLVVVALGALSASLALLMARWHFAVAADALAIAAALLGLSAFLLVARSTIQRARHLPPRRRR